MKPTFWRNIAPPSSGEKGSTIRIYATD